MFLKIIKKNFYLFIIITAIIFFSCAENSKGEISIKNKCCYYIVDLEVGDTSFHTIRPYESTSSKSFTPGSYKIKGTIDLTNDLLEDIEIKKTIQVNILRKYTIKIRNDGLADSHIVIVED